MNKTLIAHILATITVTTWGVTFISTKVLLESFSPIAILIMRFALGYLSLWLFKPKIMPFMGLKNEFIMLLAGICGITLYFLFENIALTYTYASNVGIIIAIVPFLTAMMGVLIMRDALPSKVFFVGFIIAMSGIAMISLNGSENVGLNPFGDFLTLFAALVWSIYSNILRIIARFGRDNLLVTRRIFFYGIIFMIPAALIMGLEIDLAALKAPENFLNLIFLGVGASALGFVMWGMVVNTLGAVKTSVYLYSSPIITTVASALILKEEVSLITAVGISLTLAGLILSGKERQ